MKARWLIIDGNNLVHAHPDLADLARQDFIRARGELVRRLDELVEALAGRITVVFDSTKGGRQTGFESSAVEVIFAPPSLTADSVIERLALQAPDRETVTVVSSDHMERDTVEASGVHTLSCRGFVELMSQTRVELRGRIGQTVRKRSADKLGDFFP